MIPKDSRKCKLACMTESQSGVAGEQGEGQEGGIITKSVEKGLEMMGMFII